MNRAKDEDEQELNFIHALLTELEDSTRSCRHYLNGKSQIMKEGITSTLKSINITRVLLAQNAARRINSNFVRELAEDHIPEFSDLEYESETFGAADIHKLILGVMGGDYDQSYLIFEERVS